MRAHELPPAIRERIASLLPKLRSAHDEFERAAQSWTSEAGGMKRDARKARDEMLREIENLLAREGEGDRFAGLARLPFAMKLVELETLIRGETAIQEATEARPASTPPTASRESARPSEVTEVDAVVRPNAEPPEAFADVTTPDAVFATMADSTADSATSEPTVATIVASGIVAVSTEASESATDSVLPEPGRAPPPEMEIARSSLPVLPTVTYGRRRSIVASVMASPFRMGVALLVLVLAILGGWQAARIMVVPGLDRILPGAAPRAP